MNLKACLVALVAFSTLAPARADTPQNRVASVYVSQDFINERLAARKSELIQEMNVALDPDHRQIYLRGRIQVPVEELRAINLDPKLGAFRFQVTIRPSVTQDGYLVLDFPLSESFFYPALSKDPKHERVVVPVQLLSLALASARGYLAALSGDFSSFDRQTAKLTALKKSLDRSIELEKNPDARAELENQRESTRLKLAAVPVERKQLETASKQVAKVLGFTGEKELNLNDELAARKNALILKVQLSQLTPYLKGVSLGGLRVLLDRKDGTGQRYLALDIDSTLASGLSPRPSAQPAARPAAKVPPSLVMRLNQALFESTELVDAEKREAGSKIRDLDFQLEDDGLHVSGKWHGFLFLNVPFATVVDFVATGTDQFEVRVRELKAAGIDFEFLSSFVLETMKKRLDHALKGICRFDYVGTESDHSRALRVTVEPSRLVPAFPDLHLVGVDVRDREFLLKIGRPAGQT